MTLKKIDHVRKAYERIVISSITSPPSPDEVRMGLERLEDMMNEFYSRNICSNWLFEEEPNPNTDSQLDSAYNFAVETNLALRLVEMFGKDATPILIRNAASSLSNWSARSAKTNQINPPQRQPRGSGNTFRFESWVRFYKYQDSAPISCDTFQLKKDGEDYFTVDFSNYLLAGATITSFELDTASSNGITVLESSLDSSAKMVNLKVRGDNCGFNQLVVKVETTTGRINPQDVNFNVID